ncbi:MAG: hypothetical protein JOZ62_12515 [Acidobacteriaceae bacterium]|nr:hypothetical protein [Acidobacteriaceae bacterium]
MVRVALATAVLLAACSHPHLGEKTGRARKPVERNAASVPRKIYKFSVIPGGAFSAEELRIARAVDRVVASHYADFGSNSVTVRLPADSYMHVSYRMKDRIYWTRERRRIPKGELVLTDGKKLARARCGNRLSFEPQQPTAPHEPSEEALNAPEPPQNTSLRAESNVPLLPPEFDILSPAASPPLGLPEAYATNGFDKPSGRDTNATSPWGPGPTSPGGISGWTPGRTFTPFPGGLGTGSPSAPGVGPSNGPGPGLLVSVPEPDSLQLWFAIAVFLAGLTRWRGFRSIVVTYMGVSLSDHRWPRSSRRRSQNGCLGPRRMGVGGSLLRVLRRR